MDDHQWYPGEEDAETGERWVSLSTFLITLPMLFIVLIAGQLWFEAVIVLITKITGIERTRLGFWSYAVAALLLTVLFAIIARSIIKKPIHLFY